NAGETAREAADAARTAPAGTGRAREGGEDGSGCEAGRTPQTLSVRRSHAMPEITLRCPACKVLLKLKKLPVGKTAMPCPKCGTKVPLPREEEPEEEVPEVEVAEEDDQ